MKKQYSINRSSLPGVLIICLGLGLALRNYFTYGTIFPQRESIVSGTKIVSGVLEDARFYGVGDQHFIEVRFANGTIQSFRTQSLPVLKIGTVNNFELEPIDPVRNDSIYELNCVVFSEPEIKKQSIEILGDSISVESNSHYEPIIK